jgi:16S rRNA (adenine1518-N6/adenine1519-N6)-dimethyltransferase
MENGVRNVISFIKVTQKRRRCKETVPEAGELERIECVSVRFCSAQKSGIFVRMFTPRKSLGQNFLRDENIIRKIVESLHLASGDSLLEIGPGQGALTKLLVQMPIQLIAVEVDPRAVALLNEMFAERATILQANVLDIHLKDYAAAAGKPIHIAGNIPYHLTSEILFWILDQRAAVARATLMVQLEVAQRLGAKPGTKEYGVLSVFTQYYTEHRLLFKVSRNCFFPKPDVDSAVVQLTMRPSLPSADDRLFRSVVRSTFGHRRKTLRNGLKGMGLGDAGLDRIAFNLKRRPEELRIDEFVELTSEVAKQMKDEY